jgi:hypothetical protein
MRVLLGKFACSCIEARFGGDVASAVGSAVREYAEDLAAGSVDWADSQLPVPRFWLEGGANRDGELELEVFLAARTQRILEGEARRRGLALEQLVNHAVFLALAGPQGPGPPGPELRPDATRREQPPGCYRAALELTASRRRR